MMTGKSSAPGTQKTCCLERTPTTNHVNKKDGRHKLRACSLLQRGVPQPPGYHCMILGKIDHRLLQHQSAPSNHFFIRTGEANVADIKTLPMIVKMGEHTEEQPNTDYRVQKKRKRPPNGRAQRGRPLRVRLQCANPVQLLQQLKQQNKSRYPGGRPWNEAGRNTTR